VIYIQKWFCLSCNLSTVTIDNLVAYPDEPWDWDCVSDNSNITMRDIIAHPEKPWNWDRISGNPNITMNDLLAHPEKAWNWGLLSANPNLTVEWIKSFPDKPWDWERMSLNYFSCDDRLIQAVINKLRKFRDRHRRKIQTEMLHLHPALIPSDIIHSIIKY
jgi:hypothetical protein